MRGTYYPKSLSSEGLMKVLLIPIQGWFHQFLKGREGSQPRIKGVKLYGPHSYALIVKKKGVSTPGTLLDLPLLFTVKNNHYKLQLCYSESIIMTYIQNYWKTFHATTSLD